MRNDMLMTKGLLWFGVCELLGKVTQ